MAGAAFGHIDDEFMDVPHVDFGDAHASKIFALRDKNGKLAPYFITISNIVTDDMARRLSPVMRRCACLSDGRFFWDQDRRTRCVPSAGRKITFRPSSARLRKAVTYCRFPLAPAFGR